MKKPYKKIIINVEHKEIRAAVLENGILAEYYVEREEEERKVGNVYKGKADAVIQGIQSAFVDVGLEKNGFLYVTDVVKRNEECEIKEEEEFDLEKFKSSQHKDINDLLKVGDEVLVQVEKDPISSKGVRLTTYVSLPGKFVVLMPLVKHRGISKKIQDPEERKRLRDIFSHRMLRDYGCIMRTSSMGKGKRQILADMRSVIRTWELICKGMRKKTAPALLYEEKSLIARMVRDQFKEDVEALIIDSKFQYNEIRRYLSSIFPELKDRVKLYSDSEPIFDFFDLEKEIEKIYKKTVSLKCGGYLVIEQTEALVSIYVNRVRHIVGKDFEE